MYRHGRHGQDSKHPWHRRRLNLITLVSIGLIGGLLPTGCGNPVTRYKVLSFFFDGVPLSPEIATTMISGTYTAHAATWATGPPGCTLTAASIASVTSRSMKIAITQAPISVTRSPRQKRKRLVFHTPWRRGDCKKCHTKGDYRSRGGDDTCRQCHKLYYDLKPDDWSHGPVSLGKCTKCHVSHKSRHKGLLTDATPALCFTCHDASGTLAGPHHVEATQKECKQCHDPHFAGNRMLLVDSGTYKRRRLPVELRSQAHRQWRKERTCAKCHVGERFSKPEGLVADRICLTCHEKVKQPPTGQRLHQPVRKGMCTTCHDHNSPLPQLIKPLAEKICLGCHDIEEIQTDTHPQMHRADCLLCHSAHSSPRKHLLKPVNRARRRGPDTRPVGGTPVEQSP